MRTELDIVGCRVELDIESTRFESLGGLLAGAARHSPAAPPAVPAGGSAPSGGGAAVGGAAISGDGATASADDAVTGIAPAADPRASDVVGTVTARLAGMLPAGGVELPLRIGRRVWAGDGRVLVHDLAHMPGLELLVSRPSPAHLDVQAGYRQARLVEFLRSRYKRVPLRSLHQNLLYFTVFFPALALTEERGATAVHAAGLRARGRTWLVSGVGGSGKTTLALAFLGEPEAQLTADNIVVVDGSHLRGLPELVRRDELSRKLLPPEAERRLRTTAHGAEHGRAFVELPGLGAIFEGLDVVLHVVLGRELEIHEIDAATCAARQIALDNLALEMLAYLQFTSVLDLAGVTSGAGEGRRERLATAFAGARCLQVTIPLGRPLVEVVDALEDAL